MRIAIKVSDQIKPILHSARREIIANVAREVRAILLDVKRAALLRVSNDVLRRRTGNLARAIGRGLFRVQTRPHGVTGLLGVGGEAYYARYLEYGTRPYTIVPRRAKALSFTVGGETIFARRVQHPGLKPHPFWFPSWRDVLTGPPSAETRLRLAIERVWHGR
jgi:hypothetical protein